MKYRNLDHAIRAYLTLKAEKYEELQKKFAQLAAIGVFVNVDDCEHDGNFLTKTDIKSAFCLVPVLPRQCFLLLMRCVHPVNGKIAYFVEKNLSFGTSRSCAIFSDALCHIIESLTDSKFLITNYLDDYLFSQKDEQMCNKMVRKFLKLCECLGCPIVTDKTEWVTQIIVFLGMLIDGKHFCLSIPEEKRIKALSLIDWTIDKRKVTIHHIQRLTGTFNFLNRAIIPGHAFTRRMYAKLKLIDKNGNPLKQHHHIWLNAQFIQDCYVWKMFLNNIKATEPVAHSLM